MRYVDNFGQEDDDFDEMEAEMMADAIAQNNKNHEEQLRLAHRQMQYDLLDKAIFVSKGWLWNFLPHSVKLYEVARAYETLKKLIS